ncbi:MAG: TRAP transporter small permease [Alphaproteobacteria bacterium]|nr:TRAP transporter small permease [Alphaproteobacteria bacterium]MCB9928219.1 TRAP transporter small permease [Alphaproteobacteria bacterium]
MVDAIGFVERLVGGLNRLLLLLCKAAAVLLLAVMTGIIIASVFCRYVLSDAIPWSEEIAKFVMVWMTFIVAPVGLSLGAHIAIDALANALKGRLYFLLLVGVFGAIIALMLMFVDQATFLTQNARIQRASTIDVSISYVYAAMPIGCAVTALVALEFWLNALKGVIDPARGTDRHGAGDPSLVG